MQAKEIVESKYVDNSALEHQASACNAQDLEALE